MDNSVVYLLEGIMTHVVLADGMRRTETPNAVMTTVASPTQGASERLSLWRVEMRAGQRGPRHTFDSEQVWQVLDGEVEIVVGDEALRLGAGDAVVLPAGVVRQVVAVTGVRLVVCGYGTAVASVPGAGPGEATAGVVPAWIS